MKRPIINQKLTAGLVDQNTELFAVGTELMGTENGHVTGFRKIDPKKIHLIESEMMRNRPALTILKKWCENFAQMVDQYAWCNHGGYDIIPDIDMENKRTHSEYWQCGLRGKCEGEGIVCKAIDITRRETEIIKELSSGSPDKQITDRLNISKNTLDTHKKNIYSKLGVHSKTEITRFAMSNNLI